METQHSPGPWLTKEGQVYAENGDGRTITLCITYNDEDAANARLIAAAPTMYEALLFAHDQLSCTCDGAICDCAVAQVGAAIAKAEGR